MYDNYLFLTRLTKEFNKLVLNTKLLDIFSQSKNELIIQFEKEDSEIISLIFNFNTLPPIFYHRQHFIKANRNVISVFRDYYGATVRDVIMDDFERNIKFVFDDFQIVFTYRSKHTNVYLVNFSGRIIATFKKNPPAMGKQFDDFFHDKELDFDVFKNSDKFSEIIKQYLMKDKNKYHNVLHSVIIIEVLARNRLDPNNSYFDCFQNLQKQFLEGDLFIYDNQDISIGRFYSKKHNFLIENDFFNGVRTAYYEKLKQLGFTSIKNAIDTSINKQMHKIKSKLANLKSEKVLEDRSETYRNYANILIQYLDDIKKTDASFIYEEPETGNKIEIKLNRAKKPGENVDLYFDKAKDEKARLKATHDLIGKLEKNYADLEATHEIIRASMSMHELKHIKDQFKPKPKPKKIIKKQEIDYSTAFKTFTVAGDYLVYVGKDSKSNDILTTKFAKKEDIWFHARGAVGSHCILRKKASGEIIPKEAIREAAAIAAFYSKAKTSEFVPVSYTERKYVQKKKEMAPGSVTMLREKVIMVKPILPDNSDKEPVQTNFNR